MIYDYVYNVWEDDTPISYKEYMECSYEKCINCPNFNKCLYHEDSKEE